MNTRKMLFSLTIAMLSLNGLAMDLSEAGIPAESPSYPSQQAARSAYYYMAPEQVEAYLRQREESIPVGQTVQPLPGTYKIQEILRDFERKIGENTALRKQATTTDESNKLSWGLRKIITDFARSLAQSHNLESIWSYKDISAVLNPNEKEFIKNKISSLKKEIDEIHAQKFQARDLLRLETAEKLLSTLIELSPEQ